MQGCYKSLGIVAGFGTFVERRQKKVQRRAAPNKVCPDKAPVFAKQAILLIQH